MKFAEFCRMVNATPRERRELWIYLAFYRVRKMLEKPPTVAEGT